EYLEKLWRALRRPIGEPGASDTPFGRTNYVYEILATAKAQTALRYWNWSFSADSQEINTNSLDDAEDALLLTPARRNAALLFGRFSQES
ncbi:MAG: hypothetical protein WCO04_19785, partial [Pseudomonadota bacterium]